MPTLNKDWQKRIRAALESCEDRDLQMKNMMAAMDFLHTVVDADDLKKWEPATAAVNASLMLMNLLYPLLETIGGDCVPADSTWPDLQGVALLIQENGVMTSVTNTSEPFIAGVGGLLLAHYLNAHGEEEAASFIGGAASEVLHASDEKPPVTPHPDTPLH